VRWVDLGRHVASSLFFLTFYMKEMIQLSVTIFVAMSPLIIDEGTLHLAALVILHKAATGFDQRPQAAWCVRGHGLGD